LCKDTDKKNWKRVVVFRTDRLGDLILSLPVVEALKASLPEAKIDLVVNPYTVSLAKLQRSVSGVIPDVYPGFRGLRALTECLRSEGYDLAVHLFPIPRLALATYLAGVPVRAGTIYRYFSPLFNRRIRLHRKTMVMHERDLNLKILEGIGLPGAKVSAGLKIPQKTQEDILALLASRGVNPATSPFIVLHPGSGGSSLNWPPTHFGSLGKRLLEMGFPVILTGTDEDRSLVYQVRASAGEGATDLCGQLDLEHLAALLSEASLVVSNSTGPLHLADALGKKVIGLYSPFLFSSPRRWGPYGQPENVFVPPGKLCSKCTAKRCEEYNCMSSIDPEVILERALSLLLRVSQE
jgi:lipopolysaccharide heptosyltransferase II